MNIVKLLVVGFEIFVVILIILSALSIAGFIFACIGSIFGWKSWNLDEWDTGSSNSSTISGGSQNLQTGDAYVDASGAWRNPGEPYIDASGAWRNPGDAYVDASGAWRNPGDAYVDASGTWRNPGDAYVDASGAWRNP